ncbi:MAG TPA: MauE/DoxX family redox-associated membrane protein, partial [Bacteroidia bacterium]
MFKLPLLKKIAFAVICALMGGVFIFSAYTKLYPIEPFEYTFVDLGISNWQMAPFIARLLIAFEFLIGVLLVLNIALKRFTYKLGIITLLVFCV